MVSITTRTKKIRIYLKIQKYYVKMYIKFEAVLGCYSKITQVFRTS